MVKPDKSGEYSSFKPGDVPIWDKAPSDFVDANTGKPIPTPDHSAVVGPDGKYYYAGSNKTGGVAVTAPQYFEPSPNYVYRYRGGR